MPSMIGFHPSPIREVIAYAGYVSVTPDELLAYQRFCGDSISVAVYLPLVMLSLYLIFELVPELNVIGLYIFENQHACVSLSTYISLKVFRYGYLNPSICHCIPCVNHTELFPLG